MMRVCNRCNIKKDIGEFHWYHYKDRTKHRNICKNCMNNSRKEKYDNNEQYREQIISNASIYKKNNRDKINKREQLRKQNDIEYKLFESVRSAIKGVFRKKGIQKDGATSKYLPYTIPELKKHLENQFEPWMNWNNKGKYNPETWDDNDSSTWAWQLDHIIPQSDLPFTSMKDENFKKCWALENLRPYSAKQNIIDGPARVRHVRKNKW